MVDKHFIYILQHKESLKVYVGYSSNPHQRWIGHKSRAFNPNEQQYNQPLYRAIRKHGWDAFTKEVIEQWDNEADALEAEKFWIEYLRSDRTKYGKEYGYNMHEGGNKPPVTKPGHLLGTVWSDVNKDKRLNQIVSLGHARKGKTASLETKAKNAASHLGCTFTRKLTPARKTAIAADKRSLLAIAADYDVTKATVYRVKKKLGGFINKRGIPLG